MRYLHCLLVLKLLTCVAIILHSPSGYCASGKIIHPCIGRLTCFNINKQTRDEYESALKPDIRARRLQYVRIKILLQFLYETTHLGQVA